MSDTYRDMAHAFAVGDLDPERFPHKDHVGVAWCLLRDHDYLDAVTRYVDGLRQLTLKAGVPEKFNMTVTLAFMSLIAERLEHSPKGGFESFLADNPDLCTGGLLERWYSPERLASAAARAAFVMPDRPAG